MLIMVLFIDCGKLNLTLVSLYNIKDKARLDELMEYQHLDTVQAYGLVLEFKKMFDYKKPSYAAKYFLFFYCPW